MACWSESGDPRPDETVSVCPACGRDVDKDGYSTEAICSYSTVVCETCGAAPCDLSC